MSAKRPAAAIAVIGTELTLGQSRESNSEYLGRWLGRIGCTVRMVLKLPDDPRLVADELRCALGSADFLIVTGGLGATHDDVTRAALAELLSKPLVLDKSLEERIGPMTPPGADYQSFIKQAYLPEGSSAIGPIGGTAPGITADYLGKAVYALPGVPAEMKAMLDVVAVDLEERFGRQPGIVVKRLKVIGASEPAIAGLMDPVIKKYPDLTVNVLAGPEEIRVTLIGEERLEVQIDQAMGELAANLGDYMYGLGDETISTVVGRLLVDLRLTIGVAESITGGQIGAQIAATPGSSRYLMGGIIAYSNDVKERLLNVPHETLAMKGAVSPEVALAMAQGARLALRADIGLAVTGIAGPNGGSIDKPVGLVFAGLSHMEGSEVKELRLKGDRQAIQRKTAVSALNILRLFLLGRGGG